MKKYILVLVLFFCFYLNTNSYFYQNKEYFPSEKEKVAVNNLVDKLYKTNFQKCLEKNDFNICYSNIEKLYEKILNLYLKTPNSNVKNKTTIEYLLIQLGNKDFLDNTEKINKDENIVTNKNTASIYYSACKNGKCSIYKDDKKIYGDYGFATSVLVNGKDVYYIGGKDKNNLGIYKNGNLISDSNYKDYIGKLEVHNGNYYFIAVKDNNIGVYKNNKVIKEFKEGYNIYDYKVKGDDVYILVGDWVNGFFISDGTEKDYYIYKNREQISSGYGTINNLKLDENGNIYNISCTSSIGSNNMKNGICIIYMNGIKKYEIKGEISGNYNFIGSIISDNITNNTIYTSIGDKIYKNETLLFNKKGIISFQYASVKIDNDGNIYFLDDNNIYKNGKLLYKGDGFISEYLYLVNNNIIGVEISSDKKSIYYIINGEKKLSYKINLNSFRKHIPLGIDENSLYYLVNDNNGKYSIYIGHKLLIENMDLIDLYENGGILIPNNYLDK